MHVTRLDPFRRSIPSACARWSLCFAALLGCDGSSDDQTCDTACKEDGGGPEGANAPTGGGTSDGGAGGGNEGGGGAESANWTAIITADWELGPGSEDTSDVHSVTLDRDIYIGGIRPIAPQGTHHTVLALGNLTAGNYLYASGVGTNAVMFPPGVGLKLSQGDELVLQLHLFNPSPNPLSGVSGIEIIEVPEAEVEQEAEIFLPGPLSFQIPPNSEYSASGTCDIGTTQNIFAVFPHMHQLGTHFKTTLNIAGREQILHDEDYTFEHQAFLSFDPITLNPGDSIETECTWTNTTASSVSWGESSTSEMCFSIMYRYPKQQDAGFCGF